MEYYKKYLKYKNKYLNLKNQFGGDRCPFTIGDQVRIKGPPTDPLLNRVGTITYLKFEDRTIGGQVIKICIGAILNILPEGIRKKCITADLEKLRKYITVGELIDDLSKKLNNFDDVVLAQFILPSLSRFQLIELHTNEPTKKYKNILANCIYDFYNQALFIFRPVNIREIEIFRKISGLNVQEGYITDDMFLRFITNNKTLLRKLNISRCRNLTDAIFVSLQHIEVLDMSGNRQFTNAALINLSKIKNLNITGCHQITDDAIVRLRGLKILSITACNQLTDAAFVNLNGIKELTMMGCNQVTITNAAFANLKGIKKLNISHCNQETITDKAFENLTGIEYLNMSYCNQRTITADAFVHLVGIKELQMDYCRADLIAAAQTLRLPIKPMGIGLDFF
jgi:hypothetical protein